MVPAAQALMEEDESHRVGARGPGCREDSAWHASSDCSSDDSPVDCLQPCRQPRLPGVRGQGVHHEPPRAGAGFPWTACLGPGTRRHVAVSTQVECRPRSPQGQDSQPGEEDGEKREVLSPS